MANDSGCFDYFCVLILLLSGDVEINPGPTVKEELAVILKNQEQVSTDLSSVKSSLDYYYCETDKRLEAIELNMKLLYQKCRKG